MGTFHRVSYRDPEDSGRSRRVILKDLTATPDFVWGVHVTNDRDGCGWHEVTPPGVDWRLQMIDRSLVTSMVEMVENPTYGCLEVSS